MKPFIAIVLSSAALALAGCDNNKGGSSDQYTPNSGAGSSVTPEQSTITNSYQGGAISPERITPSEGTNSTPDK